MLNTRDNPDGIFVLNGQIFSVNDLINVMRRHGLRIHLNSDGLSVDGEQISSISNLDDNKCPLAGSCEKRVALVEFLKLQKNQAIHQSRSQEYPSQGYEPDIFSSRDYQEPQVSYSREEESQDFIKPNNHDLFEGNVSRSRGFFEEPQHQQHQQQPQNELHGLFDEPEFQTESEDNFFEDSFFNRNEYDDRNVSRDNLFSSRDSRPEPRDTTQYFCKRCGYDIDPSWNSCPKCGQRVSTQSNQRSEPDYLF